VNSGRAGIRWVAADVGTIFALERRRNIGEIVVERPVPSVPVTLGKRRPEAEPRPVAAAEVEAHAASGLFNDLPAQGGPARPNIARVGGEIARLPCQGARPFV